MRCSSALWIQAAFSSQKSEKETPTTHHTCTRRQSGIVRRSWAEKGAHCCTGKFLKSKTSAFCNGEKTIELEAKRRWRTIATERRRKQLPGLILLLLYLLKCWEILHRVSFLLLTQQCQMLSCFCFAQEEQELKCWLLFDCFRGQNIIMKQSLSLWHSCEQNGTTKRLKHPSRLWWELKGRPFLFF